MRIVIDLQGAQSSGSRNRGIGRYSMSLAQAIVRNKGSHDVIIALNGLFPETIEPIRAAFEGLLPQDKIRVWSGHGPLSYIEADNKWRRKAAEFARESFLNSLAPDVVYVTSLFEGLMDDAVTSIGLLSSTTPTVVTLYDLIPLINRSPYLDNPIVEAWYENKLDQIRRSSWLLAISESSRKEAIDYLGFSEKQAVNVGTAADAQFRKAEISGPVERGVRERYGLIHAFVMYTGGIDHRKNIEGLIRAYALLPVSLRKHHQLAIVCSVQPQSRRLLEELATKHGLSDNEMILTGFVPEDDLIVLYNLCKTFIFPSWHEGFGLPALEAMSCGAPVIAANTSSLPEVVGREDALFDPYDDNSIKDKLIQVLIDDAYRAELAQHGIEQAKKFTWDESARRAISSFESCYAVRPTSSSPLRRLKLAYVSPLPPERTGIADYSAELLPELSRHYDVEVIVAQESIANAWIKENCRVRTPQWLLEQAHDYDRVLYHIGNSPYHQHMFELLEQVPGVVVLHDFFLGHVITHISGIADQAHSHFLEKSLYRSHGYHAVRDRIRATNVWDIAWQYPCNKAVLDTAHGVIVHSNHPKQLAQEWYGSDIAKNWSVIPLMRVAANDSQRTKAREELGLDENAFVVCSFGMLGPSKLNSRLLSAWLGSTLSKDNHCHLIFVGENDPGDYGAALTAAIQSSGISSHITITGWTDIKKFRQYLMAADVGVQLRTRSRGETSAAVLDCMNYGLATIVNANGAMADLPRDAVWMLRDNFDDSNLRDALEDLRADTKRRDELRERAKAAIRSLHAPRICGDQYARAIEGFYNQQQTERVGLADSIAMIEDAFPSQNDWLSLSKAIAKWQQLSGPKQLLIDVSILVQCDAKSGIQRVVRSILAELLANPPQGFRVEPVYALQGQAGYRYARQFTLRFLDLPNIGLVDEFVDTCIGDVFIGLDLAHSVVCQQVDFFDQLRYVGAQVYFIVYDLLPIFAADMFPEGVADLHAKWLNAVARADGAICISRAVANEMREWLSVFCPERQRPLKLGWFHLGGDVASSVPTVGLPADASYILESFSRRPTFLIVGTIEPRKGGTQVLKAFENLWKHGVDINLVIVGKRGWNVDLLIQSLRTHSELNRRLFWLEGVTDEYLERVYAASTCLIAASEGEGFGLPLIEAAQHKLPIIARDIPVFREVAGDHAFYFSGLTQDALADAVRAWLILDKAGQAPQSESMPWLTWKQSTQNLLDVVLGGHWYQQWLPDGVQRFWGADNRLGTQVGKRTGRDIESTGQAGYLLFGPYISLSAGQYRVVIRGTFGDNDVARARMDVAVKRGSLILGEAALSKPEVNGGLASLTILLDTPYTDLEVRVWVSDDTDLLVSMIEIAPWPIGQDMDNRQSGKISEEISQKRDDVLDSQAITQIS